MTQHRRLRSVQAGHEPVVVDIEVFTRLLKESDPQMRALVYSMLREGDVVDDILQVAYLKAFRKYESFEHRSAFSTWLYTIVYRVCIDELRRRRQSESIEFLDTYADPVMDPGDRLGLSMSIDDALAKLPPAQRAAVLLIDGHGLSFEEAADALDIPPGTLGSRLSRARAALRLSLQAADGNDEDQR